MNRTTLAWRLPALLLAALVLAAPAFAQDVENRRSVVVKVGDGDPIVIIDGEQLSPEEAREYLEEHGDEIRLGDDGRSVIVLQRGDRPFLRGGHFMDGLRGHLGDPPVFELEDFSGAMEGLHDQARWLGEHGGLLEQFQMSREGQAEISRLELQSRQLAREARQAEGAERERLETELRELLAEIFAKKQELRQERIERLRAELDELSEEHRDREAARREIIERRLKRLLGESDRYDW